VTTITDTFNRADSGTTLGTTSDGTATWTTDGATWGISSNAAFNASATSAGKAWIDTSNADGSVQVTITVIDPGSSGNVYTGLVFRWTDANNYWVVKTRSGTTQGTLQSVVGGTRNGITTFALVAGDVVTAVLAGSSITIKVNGSTVATTTDSFNATATKHGLFADTSTGRLDNWSYTTPVIVPRPPWRPVIRSRAVNRAVS
jgi:hypothetical protein